MKPDELSERSVAAAARDRIEEVFDARIASGRSTAFRSEKTLRLFHPVDDGLDHQIARRHIQILRRALDVLHRRPCLFAEPLR
jgi:hypothetical protein